MKRFVAAIAIVVAAFFANNAQAEGGSFSGEAKISVHSAYVAGAIGATLYDHPVMQQSLTVTHNPSGMYASIWSSYSPNGREDFGDEVDYSVGIARKIGRFSVDVGYAFYDMAKVGQVKGDLHALYLNLDFPTAKGITPFVYLEKDLPTDEEILLGGFSYKVGVKGTVDLIGQPVNLTIYAGGHDGLCGTKPETVSIVRFNAVTEIGVVGKMKIVPSVGFVFPVDADIDPKVVGSVSLVEPF